MNFYCNQNILSKALTTVSKAVTVRTTIPLLKGILIKASGNQVTFTASDMEISIEKTIEAVVEEEGSLVISAKLFSDVIRKLPNETIHIETINENQLTIKTTTSEFNLNYQSSEEYPKTSLVDEPDHVLSFNKDIFKNMIRNTYFSASSDESKGVIVGVLLEMSENNFNMVALDGFRMAISREQMINENSGNIVISGKTMGEILKILSESEDEEDVKLLIGKQKAELDFETTKVTVRLIDGEFIRYRDILPKECSTKMIVNRTGLLTAIERASLLAQEGKNNLIKCQIHENLLTITSRSEEGNVKEEIIVEKSGEDLEIGFNSKYIIEALKAIDDEEVVMELKTPVTPCLVKPLDGDKFEYLILPVRITNH